jgi:hypothetical protein
MSEYIVRRLRTSPMRATLVVGALIVGGRPLRTLLPIRMNRPDSPMIAQSFLSHRVEQWTSARH